MYAHKRIFALSARDLAIADATPLRARQGMVLKQKFAKQVQGLAYMYAPRPKRTTRINKYVSHREILQEVRVGRRMYFMPMCIYVEQP